MHVILRFATLTHPHSVADTLVTPATVAAAVALWSGHPLASGITRYTTASRMKPLGETPAFVAAVRAAFPCNLILADGSSKPNGASGTAWTLGLRHRLADIHCMTHVAEDALPDLVAALPSLCDRVRRTVPEAEAMGVLSALELFDLAAVATMTFPPIGRFSAIAVADVLDPSAAVHAEEHRIIARIQRNDPDGPRVSAHGDRLLLDWLLPGNTAEAAWRRRLEWLAQAAALA